MNALQGLTKENQKLKKQVDKAINILVEADNEINELKRIIKITYDLCSKITMPTESELNDLKTICYNTIKNDYDL